MRLYAEPLKEYVIRMLFETPLKDISVEEISTKIKMSETKLIQEIEAMEKEGVLLIHRLGNKKIIRANLCNKMYLGKKKIYNLNLVFSSGIVDYLIQQFDNPEAIVLIGSMCRGEDTEKSDIDIAVVTEHERDLDLTPYQKLLRKPIQIFHIDLKRAKPEILNTLANGIILHGYLNITQI